MNKAVIVEAKRTPIGKKDGILKEYEVQQLATPLLTFLSKGIKRDRRCYIRKYLLGQEGMLQDYLL